MEEKSKNSEGVDAVKFGIHDGVSDLPLTDFEWDEIEKMGFPPNVVEDMWGKRPPKKEQ